MVDVLVIGAGLPGLMAAWRLAERGFAVTVFDRGVIGGESSALAAGHVPQKAVSRATLAVLQRTRAVVEDLGRRTGGMVRFHRVGGLSISADDRGLAMFEERHAQVRASGATNTEVLLPDQMKARWPFLQTDDLKGGIFCPDDGFVRSVDLTATLGSMARLAGVRFHEGCPVERIDVGDGGVRGVVVAGERIAASRVVLAAGGWTIPLARASGFQVPLKTYVLSAVLLFNVPFELPFISDSDHDYYLIQRDPSTLLLGLPATQEGVSPESFQRLPEPAEQARFVQLLCDRIPAIENARLVRTWGGLLVGTPDANPLIGGYGGIDGLYLATGFGGGGLQRVAAAEAVAQLIAGEEPFYDLTEYRASRFDGYRGEDFSLHHGGSYRDQRTGGAASARAV